MEISIRVDGLEKHHIKAEFVSVAHGVLHEFWYDISNYGEGKQNASGMIEVDTTDHVKLVKELMKKVK